MFEGLLTVHLEILKNLGDLVKNSLGLDSSLLLARDDIQELNIEDIEIIILRSNFFIDLLPFGRGKFA